MPLFIGKPANDSNQGVRNKRGMKMDKKLKTKWLKALRSGKYRQGGCYLKNGRKFCCLGVLADIQGAKWHSNSLTYTEVPEIKNINPGWQHDMLTPREAGGLRTSVMKTLATMNDDGKTFKEIADYIEKRIS